MANAIYFSAKDGFLTGALNWTGDTVKVSLVRGYTFNQGHAVLSDVTTAGGTLVSTSPALAGKTATNGVADANDVTFSAVPSGAACQSLVIYKDTGTPSTSSLMVYIDTGSNLPITPNGGDIAVTWDAGASKIFSL